MTDEGVEPVDGKGDRVGIDLAKARDPVGKEPGRVVVAGDVRRGSGDDVVDPAVAAIAAG